MSALAPTAARAGLLSCPTCALVSRAPRSRAGQAVCPRCGSLVVSRRLRSIDHTWALIIAAGILYLPANLLPIMQTDSLLEVQYDTIMSGVVYLWASGAWPSAALVFVASIVIPLVKLAGLGFLAVSVQMRSTWDPQQRTRLYRLIKGIGRWSMLDIYVVAILITLVQVQPLAQIRVGPGALAFAAVVVLTVFATLSFDPRLIWDPVERLDD